MLDEIKEKKELKKCEVQEKYGLDYSIKLNEEKEKLEENTIKVEEKGDFLSELKKIQLNMKR